MSVATVVTGFTIRSGGSSLEVEVIVRRAEKREVWVDRPPLAVDVPADIRNALRAWLDTARAS